MRSRLRNDLAVCAIALTDDHAPSALCPPTARRELHSWLQSSSLSGITVHKDCSAEYKKLKDNKLKYIVFSIVKEIIVVEHSQVADNTKTNKEFYKDFVSHLPKDVPRYGVFDFEFYKEEGGLRKSIIFVKWIPGSTKELKLKMLYAASTSALQLQLEGLQDTIQATDSDDVSFEEMQQRCETKRR